MKKAIFLNFVFKTSILVSLIYQPSMVMAGSVNVCTAAGAATGPASTVNTGFGCTNNTGIALYEFTDGVMGDNSRAVIGLGIDKNGKSTGTLFFSGDKAVMETSLSLENNKITSLADGTANNDAVNLGQLNTAKSDAITQANQYTDTQIGIMNQNIVSLNDGAVQYDRNTDGAVNKESITLSSGTAGTKLNNVAAGQINSNSKDAINGSQLNTSNQAMVEYLGGGANYNTETQSFNAPKYQIGNHSYGNVGDALHALNQEDIRLNQRIDDLKAETRSGIAAALAVGSLPQPTLAGKNMVSMAAGTHRGESALAVGLSGISSNEKYIFKMGAATDTQKSFSGSVSVGYQW